MNYSRLFLCGALFLTIGNFCCGIFAIIFTYYGNFFAAFWFVIGGLLCDGFDGVLARASKAQTQLGIYFDAGADLITFIIAPTYLSIQLLVVSEKNNYILLAAICFFVVCGILRLTIFCCNSLTSRGSNLFFRGLPVPCAAGILLTFYAIYGFLASAIYPQLLYCIFIGISFLMLTNIKYWKLSAFRKRPYLYLALLGSLIFLLVFVSFDIYIILVLLFAGYALYGVLSAVIDVLYKRSKMITVQKWFFYICVGACYHILFNFVPYRLVFKYRAGIYVFLDFVLYVIPVITLFLIMSFLPKCIRSLCVLVVSFLSGFAVYFMYMYQTLLSANGIASCVETHWNEASGAMSTILGLILAGSLFFALCVIVGERIFFREHCSNQNRTVFLFFLSLSLLLSLGHGAFFAHERSHATYLMPFSMGRSIWRYSQDIKGYLKYVRGRKPFSSSVSYVGSQEPLDVIFIIGESARADHFSINGYTRPTSPHIESLGVVSLPHIKTYATLTRDAVPIMISPVTKKNFSSDALEYSFVSYLRHAGFYTAWISNQGVCSFYCAPVTALANEADNVIFNARQEKPVRSHLLDESLLPYLREALALPQKRKLVVLHCQASHWPYDQHYSKEYKKFTPVAGTQTAMMGMQGMRSHSTDVLINSYDNAMTYIDSFIAQVIAIVRDKNAIVFYVSDHGQSLGERGYYGHAGAVPEYVPEQHSVAFFVWMSDAYKKRHPKKYEALQNNKEIVDTHEIVFHSLLHSADVTTLVLDESRSIFLNHLN